MRKALLVWQSALAALQVIAGGSAAAGYVPEKYWGLFVLAVGALQVGTANFVHGLVSPSPAEVAAAERVQRGAS